ncbi:MULTISPECIES: helix-turn-helix domain-containing protein [unclassified Streptomyces]|uniref:helix-turn-helix domain-containing protein n=1 Tax=unclassified Streptomyces TaxID=2593676 RepID=UPI00224FAC5B|nr:MULTISPECIES: helix-turn-helix domain-containing protein [unclassified Streptomyces]MCX5063880.1 helix-turn-helix domain-containing protein [Streptomyces sp. NBC_00452]
MLLTTEHLPPEERFAYFREATRHVPEPIDVRSDTADFAARVRMTSFGAIAVTDFTALGPISMEVRRGPRLIRQSDPEGYRLLLGLRGHTGVRQGGREATLGSGDMALYDTSRPLRGWRGVEAGPARLLMVDLPRSLVPVPPDRAARVTAVRITGEVGIPSLLRATVTRMADDTEHYSPAEAVQLSGVLTDLVSLLVAHVSDAPGEPTRDAERRLLMVRIQAFVDHRLGDADLSPATIAAAHHIGARTLHRLFEQHGLTVAGWIRQRRLERCRRDLTTPSLAGQPIGAIARRWCFADGAHLSRAFKAAYGITPGTWRALHHVAGQPDGVSPAWGAAAAGHTCQCADHA